MVGDDPDVTALAAVTPVRTALGDVRLSSKTDAAGSAVARFGVQLSEIDEGGHTFILRPGLCNAFTSERDRTARMFVTEADWLRTSPVRHTGRGEFGRFTSRLVTTYLVDLTVPDTQHLPAQRVARRGRAVARDEDLESDHDVVGDDDRFHHFGSQAVVSCYFVPRQDLLRVATRRDLLFWRAPTRVGSE